ncbi:ABC transporter permease [Actinomycetospora sp. CA-084318]|uniref:ABC transporter permease n=1 Tax=Actinomycetospora sp. CA-084318 TaxID=3239892 RepID=UPI003D980780
MIGAPAQVIPVFSGTECSPDDPLCWSWVTGNWNSVLAPALVQHVYITLIAVVLGLVISLAAALVAFSRNWFAAGFTGLSTLLYTFPSLAFFIAFVPITGISLTTIEIGLTSYTLLLLFRNALTGLRTVPRSAIEAAEGMGLTPAQILFRIRFPLALPSIMAGVRVATVTVISLATVAAAVAPLGLGKPIFDAIHTLFDTELVATGVLTILLALVADVVVLGIRWAITPWLRAAR